MIKPVLDRIGAYTIRDLRQLGEILVNLLGRDTGCQLQRRLVAAEWGIGYAGELGVGIDRRARQRDRRG